MDKIKSRTTVMMCAGLLCFFAAFGLIYSFAGKFKAEETNNEAGKLIFPDGEPTAAPQAQAAKAASVLSVPATSPQGTSPQEPQFWVIYVTGAVNNPGVIKVPVGSRVYEAVDTAGGFNMNADAEGINMAAMLADGAHVKIPNKSSTKQANNGGGVSVSAGAGVSVSTQNNYQNNQNNQNYQSGQANADASMVNPNTATQAQLQALPGIGPATSAAIIQYREKNGNFAAAEDLLKVRGIGKAKLEGMRQFLVF